MSDGAKNVAKTPLKRQEGLVPRLPPAAPTKDLYNKTFELDQVFASLEAARAIDSQPLIMDNPRERNRFTLYIDKREP